MARTRIRVLDRDGGEAYARDQLVPTAEFDAARSAEIRSLLPLSSLTPGSYLLQLTASLEAGICTISGTAA